MRTTDKSPLRESYRSATGRTLARSKAFRLKNPGEERFRFSALVLRRRSMTLAHRIEAVLSENGKLSLDNLPFRAGQAVEIIILPSASSPAAQGHPLSGMVLRYDRPTEPVAEGDWSVLQ
jgi:hypothetical protein